MAQIEFSHATNEQNVGNAVARPLKAYARDNALDHTMTEKSEDAFVFDVTRCRMRAFANPGATRCAAWR